MLGLNSYLCRCPHAHLQGSLGRTSPQFLRRCARRSFCSPPFLRAGDRRQAVVGCTMAGSLIRRRHTLHHATHGSPPCTQEGHTLRQRIDVSPEKWDFLILAKRTNVTIICQESPVNGRRLLLVSLDWNTSNDGRWYYADCRYVYQYYVFNTDKRMPWSCYSIYKTKMTALSPTRAVIFD